MKDFRDAEVRIDPEINLNVCTVTNYTPIIIRNCMYLLKISIILVCPSLHNVVTHVIMHVCFYFDARQVARRNFLDLLFSIFSHWVYRISMLCMRIQCVASCPIRHLILMARNELLKPKQSVGNCCFASCYVV